MIKYIENLENIKAENLTGFFIGWINPPNTDKHLEILKNSTYIILAVEAETNQVIGFINAISDKVLTAYIPLLEVLPEYKNKGTGQELVKRMFEQLKDYYMVDICCDQELVNFYKKFEMQEIKGMIKRNYKMQCGK